MVNAAKLNDNLIHITEDQAHWNQGVWGESDATSQDTPPKPGECGTSFCLAGWAVANEGIELDWYKTYTGRIGPDGKDQFKWAVDKTKDGRYISDAARTVLGLTIDDGERLFAGGNSLARLWNLAEEVTNGKIQRPANAPAGDGYDSDYDDDDYGGVNCTCSLCR